MRRHAVQLAAFTFTFMAGTVISVTWQNFPLDINSSPCLVSRNAYSADEGKVCEIHGEPTTRRYVSILAGVPGYPAEETCYLAAKKQLFPNSDLFIIDRSRAKTEGHAEVDACDKCRAAEAQWVEKH